MTDAATTTTTAATGDTTTAAATTTTAAAAPWHGMTEPDAASYVQNKGWQSPADVIKSYQGAEKLIGRDPSTLVPLPRPDDPVGVRSLYSKLGMPEDPAKYEFDFTPMGEGAKPDDSYVGWARGAFHKVGLTAAQAKELSKEHSAYVAGIMAQQKKDYDLRTAGEKQDLLKEWGAGHERMTAAAENAARGLGFTAEMIDAMESKIGYAATKKFFANLGQKMGEDGFVGGASKTAAFGNQLTPEQAKAEWETAKLDPNFMAALGDATHPGNKAAKEKQNRLFAIMFPA